MNNPSLFSNQRINILFIIIVSMLVYINALFAGVSNLDDTGLFQSIQQEGIKLSGILSSGGGTYYRPLTILSYMIDNAIWGINPAAFHLTNLMLHTSNALLIYVLALTCLSDEKNNRSVALIVSLLFAVHPVNSESVIWISGRTDLLCALFFLLALIVVTRTNCNIFSSSILLFFTFILSLCAKESSIALLAIAPLCLFSSQRERWNLRSMSLLYAPLAAAAILYFVLRSGTAGHVDNGISVVTSTLVQQEILKTGYDTMAVLGFYFKKMIWPFPLTIAIDSINKPFYLFISCGVLSASIVMFLKLAQTRLPLTIMLLGLVPPLLAYHSALPWMPIAERYIYIPLIGFALLVAVIISNCGSNYRSLCFLAILAAGVATSYRVRLWTDPVALWADTVEKSPAAPAARVIYAYELQETGKFAEATRQLDTVLSVKHGGSLYFKCRARQSLVSQDLVGYESNMIRVAELTPNPSTIYSKIGDTLSRESSKHRDQSVILSKAISYYEKAWEHDHRAIDGLYNAARLSLRIGDKEACLQLLSTYLASPVKKRNTDQARTLLNELTLTGQSYNNS